MTHHTIVKIVTVSIAVGKAFAYFFVGFFSALVVIELTNGVPTEKVNHYTNDQYMVRYIYRPFPSGYYHHRMQTDTFNNQRPQEQSSNSNNGETRTNTQTQTFDHTSQQRTESWGTKN